VEICQFLDIPSVQGLAMTDLRDRSFTVLDSLHQTAITNVVKMLK
jgi:hypothetical protein